MFNNTVDNHLKVYTVSTTPHVQECGPLSESGIVTQVLDKSFDVLVEQYGVIKRVYCEVRP